MSNTNQSLNAGGGLTAGADLSAKQDHIVSKDGTGTGTVSLPAAITTAVLGVLTNAPGLGQAASVQTHGLVFFICGGAVTEGSRLMNDAADDGKVLDLVAAAGVVSVGTALEDGVDGQRIRGVLNIGTVEA